MNQDELIVVEDGGVTTTTATEGVPAPDAPAQQQPPTFLQGLGGMLPMLIILVLFFFWMSRSQKKQRAQREAMLNAIKKDDRVMTNGGIFGTVVEVRDSTYIIEIADKVRIEVAKNAISGTVPTADEAPAAK